MPVLKRDLDAALGLALGDEFDVVFLNELNLAAVLLKSEDLLLLRLVVLGLLLEFSHLVNAVLQEGLLLLVVSPQLVQLVRVLVLARSGLAPLVHHDDQPDDV